MHHKFAIFDSSRLLNGSYNWTRGAAEQNEENITDTSSPEMIASFQKEFDSLWAACAYSSFPHSADQFKLGGLTFTALDFTFDCETSPMKRFVRILPFWCCVVVASPKHRPNPKAVRQKASAPRRRSERSSFGMPNLEGKWYFAGPFDNRITRDRHRLPAGERR